MALDFLRRRLLSSNGSANRPGAGVGGPKVSVGSSAAELGGSPGIAVFGGPMLPPGSAKIKYLCFTRGRLSSEPNGRPIFTG